MGLAPVDLVEVRIEEIGNVLLRVVHAVKNAFYPTPSRICFLFAMMLVLPIPYHVRNIAIKLVGVG